MLHCAVVAPSQEERLIADLRHPSESGSEIAANMSRSRNDPWMVPLLSRAATGMPTRPKRLAAAYALRFVGDMRFRRQLGNDVAVDRLRSFADGSNAADLDLVKSEPIPAKRKPVQRKKQSAGKKARGIACARWRGMLAAGRPAWGDASRPPATATVLLRMRAGHSGNPPRDRQKAEVTVGGGACSPGGSSDVSEVLGTVREVTGADDRWRPRQVRGDAEAEAKYDTLHEGVPAWLRDPLFKWLTSVMPSQEVAWAIGMKLKLDPGNANAHTYIRDRVRKDDEFMLDVVDAALSFPADGYEEIVAISSLNQLLDDADSAWTTGLGAAGRPGLVRRMDETVAAVVREAMQHGHAGQHLRAAWVGAYSRDSNASHAYNKAVRAVEAAGRPVVSPKDGVATLGKMITALRAKPGKWQVVLAGAGTTAGSVEVVASMCALIHKAQLDRHGTDDEDVPLDVSLEEAQAAVHLAATLVQLFSSRAIRPIPYG